MDIGIIVTIFRHFSNLHLQRRQTMSFVACKVSIDAGMFYTYLHCVSNVVEISIHYKCPGKQKLVLPAKVFCMCFNKQLRHHSYHN